MKKLLAIFLGLLLTASIVACDTAEEEPNNDTGKETTATTESATEEKETDEQGSEIGTSAPTEIGDPGEYDYTECDEAVYVNNPDSAVTLRSAEYEAKGSVPHGTELRRIGLSTDEANYWSKVIFEEKEYYVASKFLTTIKNPDDGFVAADKTVVVNEKTGALNIRNLPSMDSTIIGHANAGIEIKVIAENTESGWYKVEFVNNNGEKTVGFMASNKEYFVVETSSETATATESATEGATESATETATDTATESETETETAGK